MNSFQDFAILAPVPEEHLASGLDVAAEQGFVAFGSMKWELFRKVDDACGGVPVPVLIYQSNEDEPGKESFVVSWFAWYTGHVEGKAGAHPDGMKFRPPTTSKYPSDNQGHWAVFWHVRGLRKLPASLQMRIGDLGTVKGGWRKGAPPRGPELVMVPGFVSELDEAGHGA